MKNQPSLFKTTSNTLNCLLDDNEFTKLQQQLSIGLKTINFDVSSEIQQQMLNFILLLDKWNKIYNLTAIKDLATMIDKHLLDSLVATSYLQGNCILDVGCGAGFPGIPLALINSDKQFVLIDSIQKKTSFVQQAIITLKLENVTVVHSRIENYHSLQQFNVIISRAYAELDKFINNCMHLDINDCLFIAMKGKKQLAITEKVPNGFIINSIETINIPNIGERCLILIKKRK